MKNFFAGVVTSFKKDVRAFVFVPIVLVLLVAIGISGYTSPDDAVYVEGRVLETYTEDNMGIAILEVREHIGAELTYFNVHVPMKYLSTENDAKKRRGYYRFNKQATPDTVLRVEYAYSVLD